METPGAGFGKNFCLTLVTNDARLAAEADRAGVNRVGIDLEYIGKAERQAGYDTRLSVHDWDDLSSVSKSLHHADLFVRINPIHAGTETEIETALDIGAEVLMLPAFRTAAEAATFVSAVRGRARVVVLVELAPAVARIREVLDVGGIDEVMVGLNDLSIQLGLANPFEVMASPLAEMLAAEVLRRSLTIAIGGVGRVSDAAMPVPTDLVHAQYPRLGATGAWLSRSFTNAMPALCDLSEAVLALRNRLDAWAASPAEDLEQARAELARRAAGWRPTSQPLRSMTA